MMANELKHKSVGSELTQTEFEAVDLHQLDSQATGDLIYASSATQLSRLAKGSEGQYLKQGATIPQWAAVSGGYTEGARVTHDAVQSIPNGTFTILTFNSERYDTDNIHDNSTNNSRLTCKTAGKYYIAILVAFATNATGRRFCQIRLNGTTVIADVRVGMDSANSWSASTSCVYDLAVNDYVEAGVYQDSGDALNTKQFAQYTPEFMMQRIG